ncbi:MAG TPA: hypothetical protein VNI77_06590 [Nitrososphaera sp.]|nr:hypothetical protein [Nitrososphaera sp.]
MLANKRYLGTVIAAAAIVAIVVSIVLLTQQPQRGITIYTPMPSEKEGIRIEAVTEGASFKTDPVNGAIPLVKKGETLKVSGALVNAGTDRVEFTGLTRGLQVFDDNGVGVFGWLMIEDFAEPAILNPSDRFPVTASWGGKIMENGNPDKLIDAPPGKYTVRLLNVEPAGIAADIPIEV